VEERRRIHHFHYNYLLFSLSRCRWVDNGTYGLWARFPMGK